MTAPADPNWLLSTDAQASAALVAIIGGFLVSRLVGLSAERQGVKRRRDQLQSELNLSHDRLVALEQEMRTVARGWFRKSNLKEFIEFNGVRPGDPDGISKMTYRGATLGDTREWIDELTRQVIEVRKAIGAVMSREERKVPPPDILADRGLDLALYPADVVAGVTRAIDSLHDPLGMSGLLGPINLPGSDLPSQRQDARMSDADRLQAQIQAMQAELDIQTRSLSEIAAPEGVGRGIIALLGLSLLGIVFPSVLMAFRPVPDGLVIRIAVILGFGLGLGGVLWFIIWQWQMLGRDQKAEDAPDD